jgi:prevent-host-death family protein
MEDEDGEFSVHSDEARRNFKDLLNQVEHGRAHVRILRYDTPAAVMVPVEWYEQAKMLIGDGPSA